MENDKHSTSQSLGTFYSEQDPNDYTHYCEGKRRVFQSRSRITLDVENEERKRDREKRDRERIERETERP